MRVMVSARTFSIVLILGMLLLCAELSECKKARNSVKKQKKSSPKITATFKMLPYKATATQQRNPKMHFPKPYTTTWPSSTYTGAYMPQNTAAYMYLRSPLTAYPRWPAAAALSPVRKFDFPAATVSPYFTQNHLRRSDDYFNQPELSIASHTPLLDMSAFNGGYFGADNLQRQLLANEHFHNEIPFWGVKPFSSDSKFNFLNGAFNFNEHAEDPFEGIFF